MGVAAIIPKSAHHTLTPLPNPPASQVEPARLAQNEMQPDQGRVAGGGSRRSKRRITVEDIAAGYRRTKTLEKSITDVLESLARLGHVATRDGRTFEIRRSN